MIDLYSFNFKVYNMLFWTTKVYKNQFKFWSYFFFNGLLKNKVYILHTSDIYEDFCGKIEIIWKKREKQFFEATLWGPTHSLSQNFPNARTILNKRFLNSFS